LYQEATTMQKSILLWTLLYLSFSLTLSSTSQAELWQGALTLPKLDSSFGLHTQLYQVPNSQSTRVMTFGQFSYGQTDQLQIETRLGLGNLNYYLAGLAKIQIFSSGNCSAAVMGGLQLQSYFSIAGDFIGSVHWEPMELYGSIHFFTPLQGSAMGLGLITGVDLKLSKWMNIYLEGDLNLADYYNAGSLGFREFF
jgi:hypothetical protein